jgi:hypothetical protein
MRPRCAPLPNLAEASQSGFVLSRRVFKCSHMLAAAVRFFKACLLRRDDFYNRYLIKNDLFRPILELLQTELQHSLDNMLISACLDFFEFIRLNNMKAVLNHLVDKYGDIVRATAEKNQIIKLLLARWEQNNEPPPVQTEDTCAVSVPGGHLLTLSTGPMPLVKGRLTEKQRRLKRKRSLISTTARTKTRLALLAATDRPRNGSRRTLLQTTSSLHASGLGSTAPLRRPSTRRPPLRPTSLLHRSASPRRGWCGHRRSSSKRWRSKVLKASASAPPSRLRLLRWSITGKMKTSRCRLSRQMRQ